LIDVTNVETVQQTRFSCFICVQDNRWKVLFNSQSL